jgi:hypothetical protein
MSAYDQDIHARIQKLDRIETQLNQHQRTVQLALVGLSILSTAVLALLLYHVFVV